MTHGEETSEGTLDDERGRMTAYVRCGFHRALPVIEEDTVLQVGPGNIESRGKEKKAVQVGTAEKKSKNARHKRNNR